MIAPRVRRILDWVLGLALIGLGILGLFLPILQGIALILAGLAILGRQSRLARAIVDRVKRSARAARDRLRGRHGGA